MRRRGGVRRFLGYCVAGGVGFLVDAGVLLAEIATGRVDPITARLLSFACAVLATFEINRRWVFRDAAPSPVLAKGLAYAGVQGIGFLCNFATYTALYTLLPPPMNRPLLCLAVASIVALIVNFTFVRLMVFGHRQM